MLTQTLEAITRKLPGTIAVMVVGLDGFIIEQWADSDCHLSLEAVAAETATLLRQTQTSSSDLGTGSLEEINLRTEHFYVLTQRITDDYFLCLVLAPYGSFGRARFQLRKATGQLMQEFAM